MKKKLLYLAIAALAIAACTKETVQVIPQDEVINGREFTLTATFESTKATVADPSDPTVPERLATTWDAGDQIAVFSKNGDIITLTTTGSGATATFKGTIPAGDEIEDGAVAYYPASIAVAGNSSQVTLPTSYASTATAKKGIALRGEVKADGSSVTFSHLGAVLAFQVKEIPIAATIATFTAKGCAGTYSVSGGRIVNGTADASVEITLSDVTKSSALIAIPIPTGTYDGFSLAFNDGSSVAKATTKSVTFAPAEYKMMKSFTVSGAEHSNLGLVGEFQGWDPATRVKLTAVPGYADWWVAKGISVTGGTGTNNGFKFCEGDSWSDNNYGTSASGGQSLYTFISTGTAGNVKMTDTGTYDIYLNPTSGKILVMAAGAPIVKTIYVLPEYVPGTNLGTDPCLHVWGANGQGNVTNWDSDVFIHQNGTTTISGITFRNFPVSILNGVTNSNFLNFWKGGNYRLQYYPTPKGTRFFELREDKTSENRGTHNMPMDVQQSSVFVRAGKYANEIESFASADIITSIIHITGTMNSWPGSAMGIRGKWVNNGILWENVAFAAGVNEWKFREYPDWDHQNICVSNNEVVTVGEELQLMLGGSQNLSCTVTDAGNYNIFLDMTTLKLLVTKAD